MPTDYDLIILGGGCAGLSLAMHLSHQGALCPKVLIIEKRAHYVNDRTWCFWGTSNAYLKHLANHNWQTVAIKSSLSDVTVDCKDTPYQMLAAEIFYQHALQVIAKNKKIEIHFSETVAAIPNKVDKRWQLIGNNNHYTTKFIVDTRPAKAPQLGESILWQSFYGLEIECANAVFNPNTATLMDFNNNDKTSVCFNYVLPLSITKALIETTVFSTHPIIRENLAFKLDEAIKQYTNNLPYTITRSEHGILPMGNKTQSNDLENSQPTNQDKSYVKVGLFAGAARPSTGYAFQRIQRWADLCAKSIHQTQYPIGHPPDSLMQLSMDKLFLQLIRAQPELAPKLFISLFHRSNTSKLIRFLSDQAKLTDYLAIMLALPAAPFLKQLLISCYKKLNIYAAENTY
ncbi:MAG: hypothetical protein H7Z20_10490 [Bdellovibrio sp.]|nr:hypothetical protein [Methylotenera sp.]